MYVWLAVIWSSLWAIASLRRLVQGSRQLIHPVILIVWIFCVFPLIADSVMGAPEFSRFPRFAQASEDHAATDLYCVYLALIFPLLRLCGAGGDSEWSQGRALDASPAVRAISFILALLPFLLILVAPDPAMYLKYAAALDVKDGSAAAQWHAYVALAVRGSQFGVAVLLMTAKRMKFTYLICAVAVLFADAWVYGKRSTVAMAIILVLYALWQRGDLRGGRLLAFGAMGIAAMMAFSMKYQQAFRSESSVGTSYEGFRIDYGRDTQIRTSLYSYLNDHVSPVLPDGVNTLTLYFSTYVPRAIWPDKPLPYAQYFTSAVFNAPPQTWGWGVTTSVFEEWVSNLGLPALVLCPIVFALMVRWASGSESAIIKTMGLGVSILFVIQHVTSFYGVFLLWVVLRSVESVRRWTRPAPEDPSPSSTLRVPVRSGATSAGLAARGRLP